MCEYARRRRMRVPVGLLLAGGCLASGMAAAMDYAVTGAASFNGHAADLDDGLFIGASYAPASGTIGAGTFKLVGMDIGDGTVELTIDIGQSNASGGSVAATGIATLSDAALMLTVTSATYAGAPIVVGDDCIYAPVHVAFAGYGRGDALHLAAAGFDVPSIDGDACNGFADAIGDLLSGNDTALELRIEGNFAPPGTIFTGGFESVR